MQDHFFKNGNLFGKLKFKATENETKIARKYSMRLPAAASEDESLK